MNDDKDRKQPEEKVISGVVVIAVGDALKAQAVNVAVVAVNSNLYLP